ncbi:interleukin-17 receptor C [Pyxicephalus adspersus]|uniref:interleukin-17 receptor C n=1 Tax=Pyxicephalus adspersus TaxID=30357 RepID=UPI003B5BF3B1
MTLVIFFILLISPMYGLGNLEKGALQTLPSDGGEISCTGDLVCEKSEMLCMPGNMETAMSPVLVPSDLRAENVKKCHHDRCSLCVQVTVEISAAFPTEHSEELGSADCDYEDYEDYEDYDYYEDEEKVQATPVNVYLRLNNSNNGSLLCANLIIAPPNFNCYTMRLSLPLSAVPPTHNSSSMVVGSLAYNCIKVEPGSEMIITSYSTPRYSKILSINHEVPDCTQLDPQDNISRCERPVLNIVNESNEISVGIINGTNDRHIRVWGFYFYRKNDTYSNYTLIGEKRHVIPKSDIGPCLCFQAWYTDKLDAFRTMFCPFKNYSVEGILNNSRLDVKFDKRLLYFTLNARCEIKAEASLCWKWGNPPEFRAIPNTRMMITSQKKNKIENLKEHPSLCVQVSVKGRILHTECLNSSVRPEVHNEAVLLKKPDRNDSLCIMEDGGCKYLYNMPRQLRVDASFLEQKLVKDVESDQCLQILHSEKQNVYVCSADKYMRSRWTWSRVLCLLVVACVLLIFLLKIEDLKKWLKSVTSEKPLDVIFRDRRVLILYSPDNPAYEELVRVFAVSLKELNLDVVLDQWHRTEMAKINPLPWYQKQKSDAFEKQGLIILLFSEGARERYTAWTEQRTEQFADSDPYGSFGAVLNCVYPDFQKGLAKGRYLVASFSSNSDVPDLFSLPPVYMLPLNLQKLLIELAGDNVKILKKKQAKRLSAKISDRLRAPLLACQQIGNRQTGNSHDGRDSSESSGFCEKLAVELEPLV